jgi:hypothetical protein
VASLRRTRLLLKSHSYSMRSYLGLLVKVPFKALKKTWHTGALVWMKRWPRVFEVLFNEPPKKVLKALRVDMLKDWREGDRTKARKEFILWDFGKTTFDLLLIQEEIPEVNWGIGVMMKMRWRAVHWTEWVVKVGIIDPGPQPHGCIVCGGSESEGVEHYLLRCPPWAQYREALIAPILGVSDMDSEKCLPIGMMLLGGRQGCVEAFADGTVTSANAENSGGQMGNRRERDWLVNVAKFVQQTWCLRREMMAKIPPRGKAQTGRPIAEASNLRSADQVGSGESPGSPTSR